MNDLEIKDAPAGVTDDLKQQCAALQRQVTMLLVALVVLSGTLSVFLWRQARYARADLAAVKQPAAQLIQGFKQEKPAMDAFVAKLAEYGKTHPDFMPVLTKYNIQTSAAPVTTTVPPAIATPKATPATVPKK